MNKNSHIYRILLCIVIILSAAVLLFTSGLADKAKTDPSALAAGDVFTFGRYMQSNTNDLSPIEWVVLERNKNQITAISVKILENAEFHDKEGGVYWPKSSIRKWLNSDFLKIAFTADEQKAMLEKSRKTSVYYTEKKLQSKEKVFLLNSDEVYYYFVDRDSAGRKVSDYKYVKKTMQYEAAQETVHARNLRFIPAGRDENYGSWWLRTACENEFAVMLIQYAERSLQYHSSPHGNEYGIRPVIVIDIKKTKDGMISSNRQKETNILQSKKSKGKDDKAIWADIRVNMKSNLFFSTYDVSLYLDNQYITTIKHGSDKRTKIQIQPGTHTICFYKAEDKTVFGEETFKANEYVYVNCSISAHGNKVSIDKYEVIPRYRSIEDKAIRGYLRDYDSVVEMLSEHYDTAIYHRYQRMGSHTYKYYLLGEKSKEVLYLQVWGNAHSDDKAEYELGEYKGKIKTGSIKIILRNGDSEKVAITNDKSNKDAFVYDDFEGVCNTIIRYMYPEVNAKYWSVVDYLHTNNHQLWRLLEGK